MELIEQGLFEGYIKISEDEKTITYCYQNKKRNYNNDEEKVQAETFLKLIFIYGYSEKRIRHFVPVKMGTATKEADMIVYNDDDCLEPFIIIECKKPDVSELEFEEAIRQAFGYAYATPKTIKYIWVTSKVKDNIYEFNKEKEERKIAPDIPIFGEKKPVEYKYAKGGFSKDIIKDVEREFGRKKYFELEIVTEEKLTRIFKQAHNALWAGGELNPSEAFDELDKLIFCKIWDERKERKSGEAYQFQFFEEETEEKTTNELYHRIKKLYEEGRKKDPEVFKDAIRLSPQKVRTVVGYLQGINLGKTDLDSKGKAFETFMGSYFRGDFGQFFTPRAIVKFIVDVLPIKNTNMILDTSCGSGGFLLYALDKIKNKADEMADQGYFDKADPEDYLKWKSYWHHFAQNNLFGIEINEQIARTAKMNMILHDDGHSNVVASDGLVPIEPRAKPDVETEEQRKRREEFNRTTIQNIAKNSGFKKNHFDFIMTNPPFGSIVKQTEKAYLHQYRFGMKEIHWLDTKGREGQIRGNQNTEILFIEKCHEYLTENGYLAIVIPDGILTNSSLQYVRDSIEEMYRIVAVVSMPQTAFMHTGAGVKSSVLFLRKWSDEKSQQIKEQKRKLQIKLKDQYHYEDKISQLEKEKKAIISQHKGFENSIGITDKKKIEDTDEFKDWKNQINAEYANKINELKEKLIEKYLEQKLIMIIDYQIFMAIAEDIGYDATGKKTGNNELDIIEQELKKFIEHIEITEKI